MPRDWSVTFNEHVQRKLEVDLVHKLHHDSVVCCTKFSPDGRYVATGCNKSAQIYDAPSGERICVLRHEAVDDTADMYVRAVCFSPEGRYLATGGMDGVIRVWDTTGKTIQSTFSGHRGDIYSLDFAPDGRTIASGGGDKTVRLWDVETGAARFTLTIEDGATSVAISPDSAYVAAGSLDNSVRVWDIQRGTLVEQLDGPDGHKNSVYSVAFSSDGKELVSGSLDRTAKIWELRSNPPVKGGKCLRTLEGHTDFVLSVAFTRDDSWVLSSSKDHGLQIWDSATGQNQLTLEGHKKSVISVTTSPTGTFFVTSSGDTTVCIWFYKPISEQIEQFERLNIDIKHL